MPYIRPGEGNMNDRIEIRDMRNARWFWCNSEIIKADVYASIKMTYIGLCLFANNKTARTYPSLKRLVSLSGVSKSSVLRSLKSLEQAKLISVTREKGRPNNYTLLKVTSVKVKQLESGVTETPKVVSHRTTGGVTGDHELTNIQTKELTNRDFNKISEYTSKLRKQAHRLVGRSI